MRKNYINHLINVFLNNFDKVLIDRINEEGSVGDSRCRFEFIPCEAITCKDIKPLTIRNDKV